MRYLLKVFVGLAIVGWGTGAHGEISVGDRFPPLQAGGLEGAAPETKGHVLLVDFWASWCEPCKESFPAYSRLHSDYQSRGLVVVAVSVDEKEPAFSAFVKRQAPPFATLRDSTHQLVGMIKVPAMPTCYLVGRDGTVRFVHRGFHGRETDLELRNEINALLAENQSPP